MVEQSHPTVALSFHSSRGGTGKTTLATWTAFYLARERERKVCLIDLDVMGPSAHLAVDPWADREGGAKGREGNLYDWLQAFFRGRAPNVNGFLCRVESERGLEMEGELSLLALSSGLGEATESSRLAELARVLPESVEEAMTALQASLAEAGYSWLVFDNHLGTQLFARQVVSFWLEKGNGVLVFVARLSYADLPVLVSGLPTLLSGAREESLRCELILNQTPRLSKILEYEGLLRSQAPPWDVDRKKLLRAVVGDALNASQERLAGYLPETILALPYSEPITAAWDMSDSSLNFIQRMTSLETSHTHMEDESKMARQWLDVIAHRLLSRLQ